MVGVATITGRGIATILLVAALSKIANISQFTAWLSGVLDIGGRALLLAWLIIGVEAGIGLLSLWRPRAGAPLAMSLFLVFAIIHVRIITDPTLASCPCFGTLLPSSAAAQWGLLAACMVAVLVQGWLVLSTTQEKRSVL